MKLTKNSNGFSLNYQKENEFLLVIKYSFEEFRRIFVDEKTLIESNEPIIPEEKKQHRFRFDGKKRNVHQPTTTRMTLA